MEWRPVAVRPDLYEVSDAGVVRNLKTGNALKSWPEKGYSRVCIRVAGKTKYFSVHKLVALAFLPSMVPGQEILHINGNSADNHARNLRWGTHSENILDAVAHGTHPMARKTHCPQDHEYTPENTHVPKGSRARQCRECNREYARRYRESRRAAARGVRVGL